MQSDSSQGSAGRALYDGMKGEESDSVQDEINPYDNIQNSQQNAPKREENNEEVEEQSRHKHKRIKKHKKQKRSKKDKHKKSKSSRHREEQDQQQEEQDGRNNDALGYFQEEADQDDEEEEEDLSQAELAAYQNRCTNYLNYLEQLQEIYKKRTSGIDYLKKFQGKDAAQVNAYYSHQAMKHRENQVMQPADTDPKTFIVFVKPGRQDDMVYQILNKASHLKNTAKKVMVVSVLAMKKKFPGKIFVEAFNEQQIRDSLQGFIDINLGKIQIFDGQSYKNLFSDRGGQNVQYNDGQYIRIKKGIYEQDLGKVLKVKKNNVDVLLVPRINLQQFVIKAKEQTRNMTQGGQIIKRKEELLKQYLNHRAYCPKNMRPAKKQLFLSDFKEIEDIPGSTKIKLSNNGLIMLTYKFDEIMKMKGTFLPIEVQPFSADGRILQDFEKQKKHFVSSANFAKGDQVEVIAGEDVGLVGKIVDVKDNMAVIKRRSKSSQGNQSQTPKLLEIPIQYLAKRFKEGQKVKVTSGTSRGKTGIILKVDDKYAQIWTENQNTIKINKNNLQLHTGEIICEQNVHGLKKDDLIKTSKNMVGIVLATRKDTIKILDTNNSIQVISNLDFDLKINSKALAIKNRNGELIKNQSTVRIVKGIHQGQRCQVKHVYKDFAFVFNQAFGKTNGVSVEKADNLAVISRANDMPRRNFQKSSNNFNKNQAISNQPVDEELAIGKTIILKTGPLKGYQGVIRTVTKDRIEVRVPSKGCTQWVPRENVVSNQQNNDYGKTPHRGPSMTNMYAPSPMNHFG